MNDEMNQQLSATADRLASAAESLNRVLEKLDAQQQALNAKVDRIVAAVEEHTSNSGEEEHATEEEASQLKKRLDELEKSNQDLKAQATRLARKTLPPVITALLGKNNFEGGERIESSILDKVLQMLSVEQRIAVKAEMARAGMIE
jgi:ABC-type transporter Mla subunit MlaD